MSRPPRSEPASPEEPEEPVLPQVSGDERDEGWGDDPRESRRDDDWYLRQRPPHHG